MKYASLFCLLAFQFNLVGQSVHLEAVGKELTKIIRAMEIYHPNAYAYTDSSTIADFRRKLLAELPPQPSQQDAYRAANRLACAFGDGHSRVWDHGNRKAFEANGGRYLPFEITVKDDQLIIRKDYRSGTTSLVNEKITAINGIPARDIIQKMRQHASRETDALDDALLSTDFPYYFWLSYGEILANELRGAESDDQSNDSLANKVARLILSRGAAVEVSGLTAQALQLAKGDNTPQSSVLTAKMLDETTAYLRILHFEGRPKQYAKAFKSIFAQLKAAGAQQLILDMRNHGGGDSRVGDELARYLSSVPFRQFAYSEWKATPALKENFKNIYLPKAIHWALPLFKGLHPHTKAIYGAEDHANARVEYPIIQPYGRKRAFSGEVVLLMDNHTFSAGTCFAAMFKDYAMGTIIGQESGNLANFHADGLTRLALPLANAQLQISNSYLVRPSGDQSPRPVQPDVWVADEQNALEVAQRFLSATTPDTSEPLR